MVKDLRTNYEVSDPDSVLEGDLDDFILNYLSSSLDEADVSTWTKKKNHARPFFMSYLPNHLALKQTNWDTAEEAVAAGGAAPVFCLLANTKFKVRDSRRLQVQKSELVTQDKCYSVTCS
jgi:hypothetical protein